MNSKIKHSGRPTDIASRYEFIFALLTRNKQEINKILFMIPVSHYTLKISETYVVYMRQRTIDKL
jgi:hypothetical protein